MSIDARHLAKRHGSTVAVDDVSLEILRGEFFSILGPSGAGKTSVLRMLAGFEQPDQGEILIEGRSMLNVPPNRRPVNMVFQSYALFPHLTVCENVAFGLQMRRVPQAEALTRVRSALDMVRLAEKRDRLPVQLSGGEQQRVALARALVNRPIVLLLDEPLAALDQQLRRDMQGELKAIQEQVGITFVCVTHHQEEALTMSDRVAVMNEGKILQVGRPREIYEFPTSSFVARFIGLSNEMTGRLTVVGDERASLQLEPETGLPAIRIRCPEGMVSGRRATLLVRPERLHLSTDPGTKGFDNNLPARIEKVVYSGSETHYVIRLNERLQWKARVSNDRADQTRFNVGDTMVVRWNAIEGVVLPE